MRDRPVVSDAEWRVMHAVWRLEEECVEATSRNIIVMLQEKIDWTDGTIKTLLHRLAKKEFLSFQRKGNRHLYRSNCTEQQCVDQVCNQLLHTIFAGRPLPMLKYLVYASRLSGQEVESLHETLRQFRETLPPRAPREAPSPAA